MEIINSLLILLIITILSFDKLITFKNKIFKWNYKPILKILNYSTPLIFLIFIWIIFLTDISSNHFLWLYPKTWNLWQIITMHFVHSNLEHILSNTIGLVIYSIIIFFLFDKEKFGMLFFYGIIISGLFVLFFGETEIIMAVIKIKVRHGGSSAILHLLFWYILIKGFLNQDNLKRLMTSIVLMLLFFQKMLIGLLPLNEQQISWESHLGGLIAAVIFIIIDEKVIKINYKLKFVKK